jgi:hypothetical protein
MRKMGLARLGANRLRQPYRQGQEEQLTALGLVVNCIALYNTIYTQRALDHLTAAEHPIRDEDIERLSPSGTSTSPSPAATASPYPTRCATEPPTGPSRRRHPTRPPPDPVFRTNSLLTPSSGGPWLRYPLWSDPGSLVLWGEIDGEETFYWLTGRSPSVCSCSAAP